MELTGKKQYIKEILFITALLVAGLAIAYWLDPIGQTFSQDKSFVSKQKLKGNTP